MTDEEFEREQRLEDFLETVQDTLQDWALSGEITTNEWNEALDTIWVFEATTPEELLGNPLVDKIYHQMYDEVSR